MVTCRRDSGSELIYRCCLHVEPLIDWRRARFTVLVWPDFESVKDMAFLRQQAGRCGLPTTTWYCCSWRKVANRLGEISLNPSSRSGRDGGSVRGARSTSLTTSSAACWSSLVPLGHRACRSRWQRRLAPGMVRKRTGWALARHPVFRFGGTPHPTSRRRECGRPTVPTGRSRPCSVGFRPSPAADRSGA